MIYYQKSYRQVLFVCTIGLFSLMPKQSKAQQLPIFSQLEMTARLYNPGHIDKSHKTLKLNASYRNQWTKFELPNRTFLISGSKLLQKQNLNIGIALLSDQIGFTRRNGILANTAYKLKLTEEDYLALGAGIGIEQFSFDESELRGDPDLLYSNILDNQMNLSINAGLSLFIEGVHLGFSIINMDDSRIENQFYDTQLQYNAFAAYQIEVNQELDFKAMLWYKSTLSSKGQLSTLIKTSYRDLFSVNIGAHGTVAMIVGAGIKLAQKVAFNLFYDYQRIPQRAAVGDTFELGMSYLFD